MRKEAVQAARTIRALGYTTETRDSAGHLILTHPAEHVSVKLSLSPSDGNAAKRAVRTAHTQLGLAPPAAASKRRPAQLRRYRSNTNGSDMRARQICRPPTASPQEYAARTEHNVAQAHAVAEELHRLREAARLAALIRDGMAAIRAATTPAQRAHIEMKLRPLVTARRELIANAA